MNRRYMALIGIFIVSAIASLLLLVFILASLSDGLEIDWLIWLIFILAAAIGISSAYQAANVGRKPKPDDWHKDL